MRNTHLVPVSQMNDAIEAVEDILAARMGTDGEDSWVHSVAVEIVTSLSQDQL